MSTSSNTLPTVEDVRSVTSFVQYKVRFTEKFHEHFFACFYPKTWWNLISLFSVQIWVSGVKKSYFWSSWLIFYLLDTHISAESDSGSQHLAAPTDPDPKHWFYRIIIRKYANEVVIHVLTLNHFKIKR